MYEAGEISFKNVKSVNLDEYVGLSADHDQSYAYFMSYNFFDHIDIDKKNTNLPCGLAEDPDAECKRYDGVIESMGGVDIQLLGIGYNGHIGFNEPGTHFPKTTTVVELTDSTIDANSRFFASRDLVPTKALSMGVKNIITFDAHDPRVNNAIPLDGFDNVQAAYQMIKAVLREYPDLDIDPESTMIISPDEGGMTKCMYYSSVMGIDLGMFYKRRDYSVIINGKNPIVAHEYLGRDVEGKDVIIVDDMISSGDSILDVAQQLKNKGAKRIFVFSTFGLFCNGYENIDKAYADGIFTRIFTTNLVYREPELLEREWYSEVNMCKYVAYIVDTLNHDQTISHLLDQSKKIHAVVNKHKAKKK